VKGVKEYSQQQSGYLTQEVFETIQRGAMLTIPSCNLRTFSVPITSANEIIIHDEGFNGDGLTKRN